MLSSLVTILTESNRKFDKFFFSWTPTMEKSRKFVPDDKERKDGRVEMIQHVNFGRIMFISDRLYWKRKIAKKRKQHPIVSGAGSNNWYNHITRGIYTRKSSIQKKQLYLFFLSLKTMLLLQSILYIVIGSLLLIVGLEGSSLKCPLNTTVSDNLNV